MAPQGTVTWRRPHTTIYNDNYRYGTGLYSDTLSGCAKKRTGRPESAMSTYVSPTYAVPPSPAIRDTNPLSSASLPPASPIRELPTSTYKGSVFENLMNSALYSSYARDSSEGLEDVQSTKKKTTTTTTTVTATSSLEHQKENKPEETPRPQSLCLYDDANLFLTSPKKIVNSSSAELIERDSKKKKRKVRETVSPLKVNIPTPAMTTTTTTTTHTSNPTNGPNTTYWKEQCLDLQNQVDILTQALSDMNSKLKGELSSVKGRLHSEISDLSTSVEQSSVQSNELQKTVKRQANQLLDLQSAYDDIQRHLQDSLDEVSGHQRKSQALRKEMDRLRAEVEETLQKSSRA